MDDFLLFYRLYNMDNFRLNCNDRLIYFDERSFKVGRVFFLHRNVRFVVHELGLLMQVLFLFITLWCVRCT